MGTDGSSSAFVSEMRKPHGLARGRHPHPGLYTLEKSRPASRANGQLLYMAEKELIAERQTQGEADPWI